MDMVSGRRMEMLFFGRLMAGESKDAKQPVKNETSPLQSPDAKDQSPETSPDEEPGTFDKVYEHGRQMGF